MLPELTQDEFSAALDAVAASVIAVLGDVGPPIDALELAKALNLAVAWDTEQQGRARMVRLRGFGKATAQGSILLRPDPRRERLQWAVAHEIGEDCAVQVFDHLGVDPREAPGSARESVANQLGGRLLLPRDLFGAAGRDCNWDLPTLKSQFGTASHELIALRMLDFPPRVVITIFDQGRRTFRRGNLPSRAPALTAPEMAARIAANETGQLAIESNAACSVQAWPIHEPEWKREILRAEWLADDDWQE